MVTVLVIQEPATALVGGLVSAPAAGPVRTAALAGGSTALMCRIPGATG